MRMTAEGRGTTDIAKTLGRSADDVKSRLRTFKNATLKKGPFSSEEVGGTVHDDPLPYDAVQCSRVVILIALFVPSTLVKCMSIYLLVVASG